MDDRMRKMMSPRYVIFVYPQDVDSETWRVRIAKGWWGGPGTGARRKDIADIPVVTTRSTDETETLSSVVRAALDALRGGD